MFKIINNIVSKLVITKIQYYVDKRNKAFFDGNLEEAERYAVLADKEMRKLSIHEY